MKRSWIQNETGMPLETVFDTRSYSIAPKERLYYDEAFPDLPRDRARFLCERLHTRYHRVIVGEEKTVETWVTIGYDGE